MSEVTVPELIQQQDHVFNHIIVELAQQSARLHNIETQLNIISEKINGDDDDDTIATMLKHILLKLNAVELAQQSARLRKIETQLNIISEKINGDDDDDTIATKLLLKLNA